MTKTNFLELCKLAGDQSLPETDRWKSIQYIRFDNNTAISLFNKKVEDGAVEFVNETDVCGFIVYKLPEINPIDRSQGETATPSFITIDNTQEVIFDRHDLPVPGPQD